MTNFIPLFPLGLVVYPNETINLHIFEPRYKQLITESVHNNKPFGIATVIQNELQEYACLVKITAIVKTYNNGEMDIKVEGQSIIRILQFVETLPDKLYSGAIVNYPNNVLEASNPYKLQKIKTKAATVYQQLNLNTKINLNNTLLNSYSFGHFTGLNLMQEYELLALLTEDLRLDYVLYYMQELLNNMPQTLALQERIKLNGHFRLNK
jgi:uncharacterized protein